MRRRLQGRAAAIAAESQHARFRRLGAAHCCEESDAGLKCDGLRGEQFAVIGATGGGVQSDAHSRIEQP